MKTQVLARSALLGLTTLGGVVMLAHAQATPLDLLLDRLGAYLLVYETELSTLVADEVLTQQISNTRILDLTVNVDKTERVLVSDVMFMRLPGEGSWLGYRDIRRVDNKDVARSGPRITDLLAHPTRENQKLAVDLAWQSARYNLGTARTINVPTLPLDLMHPRNRDRFRFTLGQPTRVGRVETARIDFEERAAPALIKAPNSNKDMLSKGTVWIEPATGRLRKASIAVRVLETKNVWFDWTLSVEFSENAALALSVPGSFQERFYVANGSGESRAVYSNFRRFTTSARILPQ